MKTLPAFSAVVALLGATIMFSHIAIAESVRLPAKSSEVSQLGSNFSAGFKAGYKRANPHGLCPLPPIPPIGKNTYEDGFGLGYAQGVIDKGQ
jgi:hypothetical protein